VSSSVLFDLSGILCAADELLSGSIQGDNPQGVGVDTSLHTLEGKKRWSRGGEMGRGEKWERAGGGGERNGG